MVGVPLGYRSESALPAAVSGGSGTQRGDIAAKPALGKRRTPSRRREIEAINVTVPVTFRNQLVAADAAFLVSEVGLNQLDQCSSSFALLPLLCLEFFHAQVEPHMNVDVFTCSVGETVG